LHQHLVERRLFVDGPRVDGEAGALGGKTGLQAREVELVADQIHEVGRIFAVVDGEARVEADLGRESAQKARAKAVAGSRPGGRGGRGGGRAPGGGGGRGAPPAGGRGGARPPRRPRRTISEAARREKVISRILRGSAPRTIR